MDVFIVKYEFYLKATKIFTDTNAIMCYHCNSAYDPRCGDPFDSFSLGQVNCSVTPRPEHITEEPTLCRKIKQRGELFKRERFV